MSFQRTKAALWETRTRGSRVHDSKAVAPVDTATFHLGAFLKICGGR
jgi:hypothetical protein